jgi:hypothetical protein
MTDQRDDKIGPDSGKPVAGSQALHDGDAGGSAGNVAEKPKELTADEQMALYEKDLKENDWGHQPC